MAKRYIPDLIVEDSNTLEFKFLTVLEYSGQHYLVVIDNIIGPMVYAYVLDSAIQRKMNLEVLIPIISKWAENPLEPLSFTFARLGVAKQTSLIFRSFEVTGITRMIGANYSFNTEPTSRIKRRRIIERPELPSVEVSSFTMVKTHSTP